MMALSGRKVVEGGDSIITEGPTLKTTSFWTLPLRVKGIKAGGV
jgi:hypothetical protein